MSSPQYFQFLDAVWDQLPEEDRERFAELWQGYEQVLAAVYQKYAEINLNMAVSDMVPYTTERWLPYTFNDSNFILRAATITSTQDMSAGMNLTKRYLLKLSVDGGAAFEVNIQGYKPQSTTIDEVISKINLVAGFPFASGLYSNSILYLKSRTVGVASSITVWPTSTADANACEFVLGISQLDLPKTYPQFRYPYTLPYARTASIPAFRDAVRDETATLSLVEGTDYILEGYTTVTFKNIPPASLWAVRTFIDDENPWANFGFLTDIYQKNSARYVGVIQGLWFAFWNGPKPSNILRSLYLLFGLPTAQENGVVTSVTSTEIVTTGDNGIVRTFVIPVNLNAIVTVGQRLITFDPLVDGIWVYDKINSPGFIEREAGREGVQRFLTESASVGQGPLQYTFTTLPASAAAGAEYTSGSQNFTVLETIASRRALVCEGVGAPSSSGVLTKTSGTGDTTITFTSFVAVANNPTDEDRALRMLEEYTFLPQISVDAFIYPDINLRNVRIFLDSFKPLNKTYLFQIIIGIFRDLLGITDRIGILNDMDWTSNLESNEANDQWIYTGTSGVEDPNLWVSSGIPYFDDDYVGTDYDALNLDPHGILFGETLQIEVYSGLIEIDSFTA